jgi:N6-adenosine-specific RNA methylase IME4
MRERFNVLYADPAWKYDQEKTGGSFTSGAAQKYPTMSLEELCALPVKQILERDAVCFLWVTSPMDLEGRILLASWGFKYKTKITWIKLGRVGLGYWFRGETEEILVGIRGNVPAFRCQLSNWAALPLSNHSKKPFWFTRMIEKAINPAIKYPRKLELFARENTPGWVNVGHDVDNGVDMKSILERMV